MRIRRNIKRNDYRIDYFLVKIGESYACCFSHLCSNMNSKAAVGLGDGRFIITTTEVASPQEDEVLVKIKAAGVCHTDHDSLNWGKPIVMGHEGAGIVEAVGNGVDSFAIGDKVILNWATPCMTCFQCQEGNQHICEENSPVTA